MIGTHVPQVAKEELKHKVKRLSKRFRVKGQCKHMQCIVLGVFIKSSAETSYVPKFSSHQDQMIKLRYIIAKMKDILITR